MKKILIVLVMAFISISAFGETLRTGEITGCCPIASYNIFEDYYSVVNIITKISKANGYSDDSYELQITSRKRLKEGECVFPITFTYILKAGDSLKFSKFGRVPQELEIPSLSNYRYFVRDFTVISVTENEIVMEDATENSE